MDPEKIGKFICELRKEKNLSQYQLADMIPITRQGVSKWERGVTTPDPQTLLKLSELFDVSINELLNGERVPKVTIEETTLSILDESNKKTKTIKRITFISISIITVLLLSFLSYYFINSYNTMEVYKIGNTSENFTTINGIFITTNEKYYLKLGRIKNKIDANINNIKLFYKKGNKDVLIMEDKEVDNITIIDSYGYQEKFKKADIKKLKNNLYLEITYNDTEKEILKLKFVKDYKNNNLFFKKEKTGENKQNIKQKEIVENTESEENKEEKKEEEKKDEVQPTIQETPQTKQPENNKPTQEVKEEPKPEPPKEPEITTDQVISKIKETCIQDLDSYICEYPNLLIFYYGETNLITIFAGDNVLVEYNINENRYECLNSNCDEVFKNAVKETLFS